MKVVTKIQNTENKKLILTSIILLNYKNSKNIVTDCLWGFIKGEKV